MHSSGHLALKLKATGLILWLLTLCSFGQTQVKPGFNLFNEKQDIEIGRQSASEVEKQLPLLKDKTVESYVNRVGKRLAAVAPGADYPYQFKVLNLSDFNAFALPGGFMYLNRGLIEAAGDEAELAGVMAHEMAHVALRHGTNQVSKAYLAQAGLGVLGGVLGKGQTGDIVGAVGGFGLNSLFLKYSRNAEEQADIVATQMLAKAGYDPIAMARMFERLREQAGRDPGKVEQFFSSHPAPANRSQKVKQEAAAVGPVQKRGPVDNFKKIQDRLKKMAPAPSMAQVAQKK
jgi:beta-barrel assembly-enhancing protease